MDTNISEAIKTPSFGDGRGVSVKIKKLKLAQNGASPCVFFPDKKKRLKLLPIVAEALAKF